MKSLPNEIRLSDRGQYLLDDCRFQIADCRLFGPLWRTNRQICNLQLSLLRTNLYPT